jgi:hypothetical protein
VFWQARRIVCTMRGENPADCEDAPVNRRPAFPWLVAMALAALILSGCGAGRGEGTPTLDPTQVIEQRLPTLQAQMTGFAQQVAQSAPTVQANMTLAASAEPLVITPTPGPTGTPVSEGAATPSGGIPRSYDGGDGYVTTLRQPITVGLTVSGELGTNIEGHNWEFVGAAGQTVTIRVTGSGGCDPRVKLIDPAGAVLGSDDDGGGGVNALLIYTLPAAGTYTIRIDGWTAGGYTLALE